MEMNNKDISSQKVLENYMEGAVKISVLFVMVYWCYVILSPFIALIIWGGIIAIITNPLCDRLERWVGARKGPL